MTEIFTTGPYQCGQYDPRIHAVASPNPLSEEDLALYCTLRNLYGIFGSLIALLGVVGNVISLVILPKTGGARSAIVFLQSLGVYDTVFLITVFLLKTLPCLSVLGHFSVVASNAVSPALFPLMYIAHVGAIYSTICISSERCIAVVFPLHAVRILTTARVQKVAVVVFLWAVLYNVPRYMLLEPVTYWEPWLNATWVRLEPSQYSRSLFFVSVYFGYVNTAVKVVVPVALVSLLNVILLCYLRRRRHYLLQQGRTSTTSSTTLPTNGHHHHHHHHNHNHPAHYAANAPRTWGGGGGGGGGGSSGGAGAGGRHSSLSSGSRVSSGRSGTTPPVAGGRGGGRGGRPASHQRVTSVVLAITGTFLLSQLFAGTQVLLHLLGVDKRHVQPCAVFTQVCDIVVILVSATNFLLYYAFGEKFRKIIRDNLCCKKRSSYTDNSMSPGARRQDETTALSMRTFLHSNGDISAEVERMGSGEICTAQKI
ncbi:uncharacterized protein LOC143300502 [Babylonia areolata]|uniref:uncharacterized protein LOC143300502 n=1 Tax=Babylonia areolata TaxID=304850 RepID=UPI003FD0161E